MFKSLLSLLIVISILFLFFTESLIAQVTTIETIINNPKNYEGNEITIEGLVTQYVHGKGATNYYLIKGDYGGIIRVNTSEPAPETNQKYQVKGIVYIDRINSTAFISEKSKSLLGVTTTPPPTVTPPVEQQQEEMPLDEEKENVLLYILIAALVVLIGAFIFYQLRKKSSAEIISEEITTGRKPVQPLKDHEEAEPKFSTDTDYKTIKIVTSSPKTLKFIPGRLVITDGADKGKEFRIAGYPSPEGFIISIGRKEVKGDRAYAHIQLKEMTVSREQAEIIQRNNKLFVKNLSETNYTQLNGSELNPGQMGELSPGSTIRTGEVEFQYKA